MKMKRAVAILCMFLLLCLGLCFWYRHKMMNQAMNYQPMRIMVDGILYSHGGGVKQEKPDRAPDGTITEIIAPHVYPQIDGEANFGTVGMAYWKDMGTVIVDADQYYILRP